MIGKIVKGKTFAGCVRYVLNEEKACLLETNGVHPSDPEQMISDFDLQALLNPKVKNKVGHISLNFPAEDARLATDDKLMLDIAREYMGKMGMTNTQYLIARHTDKDHHHCHIVFNRVDNDGKCISDSNDRYRNEKVCKMLTAKHRLHFSKGKLNVNQHNLKGEDAVQYRIYHAINEVLPLSYSWGELKANLALRGIGTIFKMNGQTDKVQGVKFQCDGVTLSGSKIDRKFSYGNLNAHFERHTEKNHIPMVETPRKPVIQERVKPVERPVGSVNERPVGRLTAQPQNAIQDSAKGLPGLFTPSPHDYDEAQLEADRLERLRKKRKQRKGFRM